MSEKPFRPLLACKTPEDLAVLEKLGHFPMYGSYKVDGIRAICRGGQMVSRTMKPIRSAYAQENFATPMTESVDGELVAQQLRGQSIYYASYSAVMTWGSQEPLYWYVFDRVADYPYHQRLAEIKAAAASSYYPAPLVVLEQRELNSVAEILAMEEEAVGLGYEGLIVRRIDGRYKQDRSTLREGILVKVTRWETSEAKIIGFEEMMHNDNEAVKDERGYTKRSSHQDGMRPAGVLGSLVMEDLRTHLVFNCGTGFDAATREYIWTHQEEFLNQIGTFRHKPYGAQELPRQPSWKGLRHADDMSE